MSDQSEYSQTGEGEEQSGSGANLAELRAAADEGRKLKRENAMLRAGVDLSTPVGQLFHDGYRGDLEPEKVKEAWAQVAPAAAAPPPAPDPAVDPAATAAAAEAEAEERARQDRSRRSIASEPADPGATPEGDPMKGAYERFNEGQAQGQSREKAGKAVIETIFQEAIGGNERFIHRGWSEDQLAEGRIN